MFHFSEMDWNFIRESLEILLLYGSVLDLLARCHLKIISHHVRMVGVKTEAGHV